MPSLCFGLAFKTSVSTYYSSHHLSYKSEAAVSVQRMVLHPLLFNHLQNSCMHCHFGQKQKNLQVMAHTFLMSFSRWEESQSKMQRKTRALKT